MYMLIFIMNQFEGAGQAVISPEARRDDGVLKSYVYEHTQPTTCV